MNKLEQNIVPHLIKCSDHDHDNVIGQLKLKKKIESIDIL